MKSIYSSAVVLFAISVFSAQVFAKDKIDVFVQEAKEVLTKDFLDPDSAKYRKLEVREWVGEGGRRYLALCGELNAKNAMGAYTGYKMFSAGQDGARIVEASKSEYPDVAKLSNEAELLYYSFLCGPETKLIKKLTK